MAPEATIKLSKHTNIKKAPHPYYLYDSAVVMNPSKISTKYTSMQANKIKSTTVKFLKSIF
jgi:hypothetical protein